MVMHCVCFLSCYILGKLTVSNLVFISVLVLLVSIFRSDIPNGLILYIKNQADIKGDIYAFGLQGKV